MMMTFTTNTKLSGHRKLHRASTVTFCGPSPMHWLCVPFTKTCLKASSIKVLLRISAQFPTIRYTYSMVEKLSGFKLRELILHPIEKESKPLTANEMKIPFTPEEFAEVFRKYNQAIFPLQGIFYLIALVAVFY